MPRTHHPARRARRFVALASGASYLGLTASIAVATTVSNASDDVVADVPNTAPDIDALALSLQGAATSASPTTLAAPAPTDLELFDAIDETLATSGLSSTTTAAPGSTQPPATTALPNTPTTPTPTTATTSTTAAAPPTTAPTTASSTAPSTSAPDDPTTTLLQTTTTLGTTTTTEATTTTQATTTTTQATTTTTSGAS